jgi:hypothetical protein
MYTHYNHCHRATAHLQLNMLHYYFHIDAGAPPPVPDLNEINPVQTVTLFLEEPFQYYSPIYA